MSSAVNVSIHASQFPENIRRDLLQSLRTRQVNHKFHYDSIKQTQRWLALHQSYSPSRTDPDCAIIYNRSFATVAARLDAPHVHVIGLGCGGGQKDSRLLRLLKEKGRRVSYTPSDVSVAMVLVAQQAAMSIVPESECHPFVCDLASADDLSKFFDEQINPEAARLITFFGMIPNFEPQLILPRLAELIRRDDFLLFSANLAPGSDYEAGMQRILPLYDNDLTRDWLLTFLLDLGVERSDGEIHFRIEDNSAGTDLKRVVAEFCFSRDREIEIELEQFKFRAGEKVRLFFSYRHTPERVSSLLKSHGLAVGEQWITQSGEEGVFLCWRD
jgi:L-histidine N-alpha-methyltransferase